MQSRRLLNFCEGDDRFVRLKIVFLVGRLLELCSDDAAVSSFPRG